MKVKVVGVEQFKEHTFLLKLAKPKEFTFTAGQFAMLHIHEHEKPFSISSHPDEATLDFLVKEHDEGTVTPWLMKLKKGDLVELQGPFGVFTVKDTNAREIIFVAAGTGIAPFRAMIRDALKRFPDKRITLLFGFRYDCYYGKLWNDLAKRHRNFSFYGTSSRPDEAKWTGLRGRVTDHLEEIIRSAAGKEIYVCGSEEVVESVKNVLFENLKFKKEQLHVEEWRHAGRSSNRKVAAVVKN